MPEQKLTTTRYSREDVRALVTPMLVDHHKEVITDGQPLRPDVSVYLAAEDKDALRVYTVREGRQLVGYAVFVLVYNPRASERHAECDMVYIRPESRGQGAEFFKWCDEQLAHEGVWAVRHSVTRSCNFSHMLARQGYEKVEEVWSKRLG